VRVLQRISVVRGQSTGKGQTWDRSRSRVEDVGMALTFTPQNRCTPFLALLDILEGIPTWGAIRDLLNMQKCKGKYDRRNTLPRLRCSAEQSNYLVWTFINQRSRKCVHCLTMRSKLPRNESVWLTVNPNGLHMMADRRDLSRRRRF